MVSTERHFLAMEMVVLIERDRTRRVFYQEAVSVQRGASPEYIKVRGTRAKYSFRSAFIQTEESFVEKKISFELSLSLAQSLARM